ncbi:MAG TPA: hypothetical protein VF736_22395 [Pyrinomonadaceae bacterium]|jgi:glycosyltransferase involved in cell wall biosynthesis
MASPQKILVGTVEIARQMYDLADGFRRLGHRARTLIARRNPQHPGLRYDIEYRQSPFSERVNGIRAFPLRHARAVVNRSYWAARLLPLLTGYDVYVFQAGGSLLPGNRDLPLLKRLGKKVIVMFQGDEIRHWSAAEPVWESFGLRLPPYYRENASLFPLAQKLTALRMAERYADVIFSVPSQSELALRPYMHVYLPLDLSRFRYHVPARDVPVVVHAPSFAPLKGTAQILEALDRLRAEGVPFELRLLEGKKNEEVIEELVGADVVADQLNVPLYGMFALEGMATGCAVAGGNREDFIPLPPNRPTLHIDSGNLYGQLRRLLTDKPLRLRLAAEGRALVEKYHDHRRVARHLLDCLAAGPGRGFDYHPTFFARRYKLPEGEALDEGLKRLTARVVRRWGLPEDVDPRDLVARGLMSCEGAGDSIPRWKDAPPAAGARAGAENVG